MEDVVSQPSGREEDRDGYFAFLARISACVAQLKAPVFTTSATGLPEQFLSHIAEGSRQLYTCKACFAFLDRFGGLVTIDEEGRASSILWSGEVEPFFQRAVDALRTRVAAARVEGMFVGDKDVWGKPQTGVWRHLAAPTVPAALRHVGRTTLTASQAAAEKLEDFKTLSGGLEAFPHAAVKQALTVLRMEALYRSERALGVAEWLDRLHTALDGAKGNTRANLIWRAVATAPAGFCHVRSSMIGTLLEDIVAGLPFDAISRRFSEKMHPLQYQRPTAPLSDGNLARAEKIMGDLKAAGALERRFAKLADIQALWLPKAPPPKPKPEGIFGHLRELTRPEVKPLDVPAVTLTWDKFSRTVLPEARSIELFVPAGVASYGALVTAVDPEAPSMLQWGNPVSLYLYVNGSQPERWNLKSGSWHEVSAVALQPSMWGDDPTRLTHHGAGVFFLLRGAWDTGHKTGGGMFPESMKAEYREIRATLEAHFKNAKIQGAAEAEACGLLLSKGSSWSTRVRVDDSSIYSLDRWD